MKIPISPYLANKKVRIGYDAKRLFHNTTGLGNYARDLVATLAFYYPENEYFLYNPKPARADRFSLRENTIERRPAGFQSLFPSFWRSRGILSDLKHDGIDIFHGLSGELPFGISRSGIPSVVTVHDLIFMKFPQWYKPFDRWIYEKKVRQAVKEADRIVAISQQTKKDLIDFLKISPGKIQVIYQSCHEVFKNQLSRETLNRTKEKFQLPGKFLLYVGTVEPRKNAFTIIKALKDLPYRAVLVGRHTPYAKKIIDFVRANQMENRIYFLQNLSLEELAALYRLAQVFVYPSIYEGFGIPVIEALYSGTPVITNSKGVFSEAAGEGGIYLEDIFNADEMREKIRWAMKNDLQELIDKGYEHVKKFDSKILARQWNEVYNELKIMHD